MNITIKREYPSSSHPTEGKLYIEDAYFCNTLERPSTLLTSKSKLDLIASMKKNTIIAVPTGTYSIAFRYSQKFLRTMPYIETVPGFSGIMIHPGNTVEDTIGCILVGFRNRPYELTQSSENFEKLRKKMLRCA